MPLPLKAFRGRPQAGRATARRRPTRQQINRAALPLFDFGKVAKVEQRRGWPLVGWLWSKRQPIADSIAEIYLRKNGIICPLPPTIGFLPARDDHDPALIAAFGWCAEPEPGILEPPGDVQTLYVINLRADGSGVARGHTSRMTLGLAPTAPIVLAPVNDLGGLAIVADIEDGLAAHERTGLGVWVADPALLPALADAVPEHVEAISIHAQPGSAAAHAARLFAARLYARTRSVAVFVEDTPS